MDCFTWLPEALASCVHIEDALALKRFVFHQDWNGHSNACLICGNGTDYGVDSLVGEEGHLPQCPWPKTINRLAKPVSR
jgi:hypothetical protein